jgi:transposase InsO family protein
MPLGASPNSSLTPSISHSLSKTCCGAGSLDRLRDECLNTNWFMNLKHARDVIEDWRKDYNEVRPHSSLKGATPKEYAEITAGF